MLPGIHAASSFIIWLFVPDRSWEARDTLRVLLDHHEQHIALHQDGVCAVRFLTIMGKLMLYIQMMCALCELLGDRGNSVLPYFSTSRALCVPLSDHGQPVLPCVKTVSALGVLLSELAQPVLPLVEIVIALCEDLGDHEQSAA